MSRPIYPCAMPECSRRTYADLCKECRKIVRRFGHDPDLVTPKQLVVIHAAHVQSRTPEARSARTRAAVQARWSRPHDNGWKVFHAYNVATGRVPG